MNCVSSSIQKGTILDVDFTVLSQATFLYLTLFDFQVEARGENCGACVERLGQFGFD